MIISGYDLLLNPTEVLAAHSINSFVFRLNPDKDGFHKILRCCSIKQRDYWKEQIMLVVDKMAREEEVNIYAQQTELH